MDGQRSKVSSKRQRFAYPFGYRYAKLAITASFLTRSLTGKKPRKSRFWQFDPSLFQPGPGSGFLQRHILGPARRIVGRTVWVLAFAYPLILVTLGVVFGGLVFWASFAGSVGLIWLIVKKAGYARNFEGWDIGYRKFLGLFFAFGITLTIFTGLLYNPIRDLTIPLMGGILGLALVLALWKTSNR